METPTQKFSIEFFPPRTEVGEAKLDKVHEDLAKLNPDFFSVTYGAGGSTRDGTRQIVLRYHEAGSTLAPHLSFGGSGEDDIRQLLAEYKSAGIKSLVALRGDIPSGMGSAVQHRYANELVEFIRKETGDHFHIDVACYPEIHPESDTVDTEIKFFKQKVNAGANSAITQYFYNADAYFRFRDLCDKAGITIPIVPGIMPVLNLKQSQRFTKMCGASLSDSLLAKFDGVQEDPEKVREIGINHAIDQCRDLLRSGAPGIHFYTLNRSKATLAILEHLQG